MSLGLSPDRELVIAWRWLPRAPLPPGAAFPSRRVRFPELFRGEPLVDGAGEWAAYRFNFAQLAKMTPDLALYRLIRLFNTPLSTVSTREAGHAQWAYWQGHVQTIAPLPGAEACAHLWFFDDQTDGDLVVLEYGFDGELTLRSEKKGEAVLKGRYEAIVARVRSPDPGLSERRARIPSPRSPRRP